MNYEAEIRTILAVQGQIDDYKAKVRDNATMMFDPLVVHSMVQETNENIVINKPTGNPSLKKPELLDETLGRLHYLRFLSSASNRLQLKIIGAGNRLITVLKKEYNLSEK
jgi:hypothetical protein